MPGPVFSQVLLADEINRATPKSQSALLEVMEEQTVTVDGETHKLPQSTRCFREGVGRPSKGGRKVLTVLWSDAA